MPVIQPAAPVPPVYQQQERWQDATTKYEQALEAAQTARQRAEARTRLALVHRDASQAATNRVNRDVERRAARHHARQAVEDWLEAAVTGPVGDAHYAAVQMSNVLLNVGLRREAPRAIERLITNLAENGSPSKLAYARFIHARALSWNGRYQEALETALAVDQDFQAHTEAGIEEIRLFALLAAAGYHAQAGDPDAGRALLDWIAEQFAGRHPETLAAYHRLCDRVIAEQAQ